MTVAIALAWSRLFPALSGVDRMNELEPVIPGALPLTIIDGAS